MTPRLYVDEALILDPGALVAAIPVEGCGPSDGLYGIRAIIDTGDESYCLDAMYPSKERRNTAFAALTVYVRARLEVETDDESHDEEEDD